MILVISPLIQAILVIYLYVNRNDLPHYWIISKEVLRFRSLASSLQDDDHASVIQLFFRDYPLFQ